MATMESYLKDKKENTLDNVSSVSSKNNQKLKKEKKIEKAVALGLAGALAIGGVVPAVVSYLEKKDESIETIEDDTYDEETNYEILNDVNFEYALVEDFKVSNEEQVNAVVEDIKSNTKATSNVKNIIKFYNGVIEKDDLSVTDDEAIFKELQSYVIALYNDIYSTQMVLDYTSVSSQLQSNNINDDAKKEAIEKLGSSKVVTPSAILENNNTEENLNKIKEYEDKIKEQEYNIEKYENEIKASATKTEKYSKKISRANRKIEGYKAEILKLMTSEQKYNKRININLENTLKAIRENKITDLEELSQEFYDIYSDILNDENLLKQNPERWKVYLDYFQAISPIYGNYLTKAQIEDIKGEHQGFSTEELFKSLLRNWGVDAAGIIELAGKDGTYGKTLTDLEEKYDKDESNNANNSSLSQGDSDDPTVEKRGDKSTSSKGKQETIKDSENLGTTTEKEETLPEPSNKPQDEVKEEGGKPVGDPIIEEKPGDEEETEEIDVPPEKEEDQEEIIGETEEVYVDENGEDFEGVLTEEEFSAHAMVKSLF